MQPNLNPLPEMTPSQGFWRGTVTALVVALPAGARVEIEAIAVRDG
mgnify:CR=1 FL=1